MSVTGAIMAGVGAAGSIGGAAISSNAAGNAASTQANAANNAAQLQYQASQNALGFQEQQWNTDQQNLAPWLQGGQQGLSALEYGLGLGPGNAQNLSSPSQSFMPASTQPGIAGGSGPAAVNPSTPAAGTPNPYAVAGGAGSASVGGIGTPVAGNGSAGSNPYSQMATGVNPNTPAAQQPGATGATPAPSSPGQPPGGAAPSGGYAGTGVGYGSLLQPYSGGPFVAPTAAQALQSPGEQAQLGLGEQALQQSAAARGGLLTGGTAEGLNAYAQNLASTNYQNTYNQAFNTYAQNYNEYQNQQANQYNRLAALSGIGQTTAQDLGTLGQGASNNVTSNLLGTASAMGQQYNNAAAANASGIVGSANAWSGALGGAGNNLQQLMLLNQLYGGNSTSPTNNLNGSTM